MIVAMSMLAATAVAIFPLLFLVLLLGILMAGLARLTGFKIGRVLGVATLVAVVAVAILLATKTVLYHRLVAANRERSAAVARAAAGAESFRAPLSKVMVEDDGRTSHANAEILPPRQQLFSDLVDTWQADVYPSEKSALRALVARIDKQIGSLIGEEEQAAAIEVQGNIRNELLVQVVDALKTVHPQSRITSARTDLAPESPANKQTVIVHVTVGKEGADLPSFIRMEVVGWKHRVMDQADFLQKLWVDDYATFANLNPTKAYVVAVSQQPATSAEESRQNALAVAARSLKHRVSDQMNPPTRQTHWQKADAEPWLEGRIVAEVQNSPMIADQFVQRLQAPYGEVWQTSLLVDASPKSIANLAEKLDRLMALQERGARRTALSVAGVIALVCLVYAGLNVLTRGYFSWSLRAMALAMMAGGVFLVLLFRG